jgi:hypothetical protein
VFEFAALAGDDLRKAPTDRIVAWARANMAQASREPLRTRIVSAVLAPDWERVTASPSRFRGSYRVTMSSGTMVETWHFRTVDRPSYNDREAQERVRLSDLLEAPFGLGYSLIAYTADTAGLPTAAPRPTASRDRSMVWLKVADRPTSPRHRDANAVAAVLEFTRFATPRTWWPTFDPFIPEMDAMSRDLIARGMFPHTEGNDQPRLPITLRITSAGGVTGDTTLVRNNVTLKLSVVRTDTIAVKRPF